MPKLTNLLPEERQRMLRRTYFLRLGVVAVSAGIALVFVAAALLLPTYTFLTGAVQTKTARLATINSSLSSSDGAALSARLAALSKDAGTLAALQNAPSASAAIRAALAVARPGVTLSGFSYAPASTKTAGTLTLNGTAATRDALRTYQIALQGSSFATAADLPVSVYAKDTNIPFSILVTLAP